MIKTTSSEIVSIQVRASLAGLQGWVVSATEDSDPLFSFSPPPVITTHSGANRSWHLPLVDHDIFKVRDDLFAVDDVNAALLFLRTYGPLRVNRLRGQEAASVRLSAIKFLRDMRKEFLLRGSTQKDFRRILDKGASNTVSALFDVEANASPEVQIIPESGKLIGVIHCQDVHEATRAAVYLDRLTPYGWGQCEECKMPYKRTSRHKRKYCGIRCQSYATTQSLLNPDLLPQERREKRRRVPKQ